MRGEGGGWGQENRAPGTAQGQPGAPQPNMARIRATSSRYRPGPGCIWRRAANPRGHLARERPQRELPSSSQTSYPAPGEHTGSLPLEGQALRNRVTGGRPDRLTNLPEDEDIEAGVSVALATGGVMVDAATRAAMIWSISASCSAVKAVVLVSRPVARVSSPVAIGRSVTACR